MTFTFPKTRHEYALVPAKRDAFSCCAPFRYRPIGGIKSYPQFLAGMIFLEAEIKNLSDWAGNAITQYRRVLFCGLDRTFKADSRCDRSFWGQEYSSGLMG